MIVLKEMMKSIGIRIVVTIETAPKHRSVWKYMNRVNSICATGHDFEHFERNFDQLLWFGYLRWFVLQILLFWVSFVVSKIFSLGFINI